MNTTTKPAPSTSEECGGQWRNIGFSKFRVSAKAKRKKRRGGKFLSILQSSQPTSHLLDGTVFVPPPLSANFQKSNYLLGVTIETAFLKIPFSHWLSVTLTFPTFITSTKTAQEHLNSFLTHKIRPRYKDYIWVMEPHASGRIHYHMLLPVDFVMDDVDLEPWRMRGRFDDDARLAAMPPRLRAESDWFDAHAPKCGFGRVEVAPIYGGPVGIRKYLQKHDWRSWHWPFKELKSFRFWSRSEGLKAGSMNFSWHSPGATLYRQELKEYARERGVESYDDLKIKLGRDWSFWFRMHREFCRS